MTTHDDDHPVIPWLTQARRAYLYRILLAIAAIGVVAGVVTETEVAAYVALGAAVIGTGVATANTTTRD